MKAKIVVDYPPGGLGNFIAQIYTNTVLTHEGSTTFHRNKIQNYWPQRPKTANNLAELMDLIRTKSLVEDIAICHTHGNSEILVGLDGILLWLVVVDEYFPILFLNKQLKAKASMAVGNLVDNTDRVSIIHEYLHDFKLHTRLRHADRYILFDNFYKGQNECIAEINKINPDADADNVYQIFSRSQNPIVNRYNKLKSMIELIDNNTAEDLSTLSTLDQGIISAMLTQKYPQIDWALNHQANWFQNTAEISQIINSL